MTMQRWRMRGILTTSQQSHRSDRGRWPERRHRRGGCPHSQPRGRDLSMCPRALSRVSPATSAPVLKYSGMLCMCVMQGAFCIQQLQGLNSAAAILQRLDFVEMCTAGRRSGGRHPSGSMDASSTWAALKRRRRQHTRMILQRLAAKAPKPRPTSLRRPTLPRRPLS